MLSYYSGKVDLNIRIHDLLITSMISENTLIHQAFLLSLHRRTQFTPSNSDTDTQCSKMQTLRITYMELHCRK